MRKINFIPLGFCLLIIVIFSSCYSTSKFLSKATYNTALIPKDFDPSRYILLVAEMPRLNKPNQRNPHVTGILDKNLKEYYPYRYEIVSIEDIFNNKDKYGDTSIYKYALLNSLNSQWHSTTTTTTRVTSTGTTSYSVSPQARTTYIDFGFYDRSAGKKYGNTGNSSPKLEYALAAWAELVNRAKNKKK